MSYTLKGRRRFLADLETAKTECGHYEAQGVCIESMSRYLSFVVRISHLCGVIPRH